VRLVTADEKLTAFVELEAAICGLRLEQVSRVGFAHGTANA
jgi:hypothetical protein